MSRFKGRSAKTFRMRHKPIKCGFKFYALACSETGYVYSMHEHGRGSETDTIAAVINLAKTLPERDRYRYVIAMDNYFTFGRTLHELRELGVAAYGTARGRRGWPPAQMRDVDDVRFNTLYHMKDPNYDNCIMRWLDNGPVYLVSTWHLPQQIQLAKRKRPRMTQNNRCHIREVWGDNHTVEIHVSKIICDYNAWMGGVDRSDQLIAYYRPDIRVRRTWMPLMFHCLNVSASNAYVVHKSICRDKAVSHKCFLILWIRAFMIRAKSWGRRGTRRGRVNRVPCPARKRRRMSKTKPRLSDTRLLNAHVHIPALGTRQRRCVYCSFLYSKQKLRGVPADQLIKVQRVIRYCIECKVNLCKKHFRQYHTVE